MNKKGLRAGDLVQLDPVTTKNRMFAGCFMTVTEVKEWGAQGYVQALGEGGQPGGQAYYRSKWVDMEYVGHAAWVVGSK